MATTQSAPRSEGAQIVVEFELEIGRFVSGSLLTHFEQRRDRAPMWLEEVYALDALGKKDAALDVVFTHLDGLILEKKYEACDAALDATDVSRLSTDLLVGFLTVTNAARRRLVRRDVFVERVARRLTELAPERVERLLSGLK